MALHVSPKWLAVEPTHGTQTRQRSAVRVRCTAQSSSAPATSPSYEEGELERPRWAGETPLSRIVAAIIEFKPLYSILKFGARQVFISTAQKKEIPWVEMRKQIMSSDVYKEKAAVEDPSLVYPDSVAVVSPNPMMRSMTPFSLKDYLKPFHAYDEGNLSWLAAAEAEPATMSMALRAIPEASSAEEANSVMRGNWLDAIKRHHLQFAKGCEIKDILDIGCSIGISTTFLVEKYPSAKVTGLDLSPYFLAVAQYKETRRPPRKNPIRWVHANGESTGLSSASFDLVSLAYVIHECPQRATINLVKEAFRLLRPGGMIAITDNSPKSKKLQDLSPVLFTLMKSTEPFLDEYYTLNLEETMRRVGFVNVQSLLTDPRHRTVTGTVLLS
ncbi:hypothetical protein AMTRI_Chr09g34570 [Amborella trichopoda]